MIGKAVLRPVTGERAGRVVDLLLDPDGRRVVGLLVDGAALSGGRMLPLDAVAGVGPDAVVAERPAQPLPSAGARPWRELREVGRMPVYSRTGSELGAVHDVVFDERGGAVVGYRLSGGFIQDLLTGRTELPAAAMSVGVDAVVADGGPGEPTGGRPDGVWEG